MNWLQNLSSSTKTNMKVYVVYNYMDRDGGVSAIFDSHRKAVDYVIKEYYDDDFSRNLPAHWLDNNAQAYVVEMEVIT